MEFEWVLPGLEHVGGLVLLMVLLWLHQYNSLRRALSTLASYAAEHPELRYEDEALTGTVDGVEVRVAIEPLQVGAEGSDRRLTRIEMFSPQSVQAQVDRKKNLSHIVRTGDEVFDGFMGVSGDPAEVLACMDAEGRLALRHALFAGWTCEGGVWTFTAPRRFVRTSDLHAVLQRGLRACEALQLHGDVEQALLAKVLGSDLLAVRQEALAALMWRGELSEEVEAQLLALGGTLAVTVARKLPVPREQEALAALVDGDDGETSWLATEVLLRAGTQLDAIRRGLLRGLDDAQRAVSAVTRLGEVGTVDDVMALRAWGERNPGSRQAVDAAVGAIQSRARGSGAGQLAVAEAVGGEVSLAARRPQATERDR